MKFHFRSIVLPALAMSIGALGQDAHVTRLRQVLKDVGTRLETAPEQAVSADLDITTVSAKDVSRTEHVHQAAGAGRTLVTGDRFSTYQDAETRVVVMGTDKVVYIYDQLPGNDRPTMDNWVHAREELLKRGDITLFQETARGKDSLLTAEITLREPEQGTHLQRVRFVVDLRGQRLRSVLLTYADGAPLKTQRYDYRTLTIGTLDPALERSALAQVYAGGKPLPRFRDHRIVDLRQRSTRHAHR